MKKIQTHICTILALTCFSLGIAAKGKHHSLKINEYPGGEAETRAPQVQKHAPKWPKSQKGDTAAANFFSNNFIIGGGNYFKKNDFSSLQWIETYFLYAPSHNSLLNFCTNFYPWCSPLVLDLGRDGINLGEFGEGVFFDIIADGIPKHIQWVARDTDDGFLALDINDNGRIDDGSEIFGQGTELIKAGEKPTNGYDALAQYDDTELGGNGDGVLDQEDSVWSSLLLWVDNNANGTSERNELYQLRNYEIISIDLRYGYSNRVDHAGNIIPYWSWVTTTSKTGPKKLKMVDVFFRVIE